MPSGRLCPPYGSMCPNILLHQVPPDALEGWVAQQSLAGFRAVLGIDHHARLDPACLRKLARRFDRRLPGLQFLKLVEDVFLVGFGEAALELAGIDQLAAL